MKRKTIHFYFLNIGHFLDHLFVLIFATAVLKLALDWNLSYAELLPYATPGMIAFGLGAIPAGWIADKWRRDGMMQVFFIGIGIASIACSFATTPREMAVGLLSASLSGALCHGRGILKPRTAWSISLPATAVSTACFAASILKRFSRLMSCLDLATLPKSTAIQAKPAIARRVRPRRGISQLSQPMGPMYILAIKARSPGKEIARTSLRTISQNPCTGSLLIRLKNQRACLVLSPLGAYV